ncbi:MAG: glycosyltransferase family 4 protein [Nostocaceae cyanobacterium]|nr:glycosyltransferase family 4 protein [Nostocaceae cyanobacterium]
MQSTQKYSEKNRHKFGKERKIMLFDLSIRGHHPNYIQHLIKYWQQQEFSGSLDIVVSPKFLTEHAEVVELAAKDNGVNINFVAITEEEENLLNSRKSRFQRALRNFKEWQILCKYAKILKANHCLVMYFDTCEVPLGFGAKSPCPFSGIYFRPTFHYNEFAQYHPSWKDSLQQWREKLFLSRILQNPNLKNLFCLDPFVVKHLDKFNSHVKGVPLPDPVETFPDSQLNSGNLRENLGIDAKRKIFLLFGALTTRKGIYQLLDAISALSPELCQKMCLLLVGESNIEAQLKSRIAEICESKPVQIISRYEFISEQEIPAYFQLADVVLSPYQRHVGMSGILLLAAAAQKPVLSSDYGLMGEIVRRYELGLTVDSTVPKEISQGLTQFLGEYSQKLGNPLKMKSFAQQNSAQEFARIIFDYL